MPWNKLSWVRMVNFICYTGLYYISPILYIYIYIYIQTYIHIYIYVCVCVCVCVFKNRKVKEEICIFWIYLFCSYVWYICMFPACCFVREHVWHKVFLMGYSMRLELNLVSSINDPSLVKLVYAGVVVPLSWSVLTLVCIYIYIYIQREREREWEKERNWKATWSTENNLMLKKKSML